MVDTLAIAISLFIGLASILIAYDAGNPPSPAPEFMDAMVCLLLSMICIKLHLKENNDGK